MSTKIYEKPSLNATLLIYNGVCCVCIGIILCKLIAKAKKMCETRVKNAEHAEKEGKGVWKAFLRPNVIQI